MKNMSTVALDIQSLEITIVQTVIVIAYNIMHDLLDTYIVRKCMRIQFYTKATGRGSLKVLKST